MPGVDVSAIVVNHNRRELLRDCLASLVAALDRAGGATELIVVDNGSHDGSSEMVRADYPSVALVQLSENRGFGAAASEGIRRSGGEWVLLVNNDATVEPDAVERLLAAGSTRADVGSVAAQLRFAGTSIVNSAGIVVDRLGVAYTHLLGTSATDARPEPVEVFGASAGGALYRRRMLDEVGGFDESFFVYLEDADLAWRARMRGWRCVYAPDAVVHHRHSSTARHGSSFKHFHVGLNRVRLIAKNADRALLARYGAAMLAYDVAYVAFAAATDRTLAPLRGRLAGLRQWRAYRRAGAGRRAVTLAPPTTVGKALRRWASLRRLTVGGGASRRRGRSDYAREPRAARTSE